MHRARSSAKTNTHFCFINRPYLFLNFRRCAETIQATMLHNRVPQKIVQMQRYLSASHQCPYLMAGKSALKRNSKTVREKLQVGPWDPSHFDPTISSLSTCFHSQVPPRSIPELIGVILVGHPWVKQTCLEDPRFKGFGMFRLAWKSIWE